MHLTTRTLVELCVSLGNIGIFCRALLQKRPIISGSLLIDASDNEDPRNSVLQCDAVCCSVSQCVSVSCSQCLLNTIRETHPASDNETPKIPCCSTPKIPCCSALQCVAVRCSALQCVAVCCSVLQQVLAEYNQRDTPCA